MPRLKTLATALLLLALSARLGLLAPSDRSADSRQAATGVFAGQTAWPAPVISTDRVVGGPGLTHPQRERGFRGLAAPSQASAVLFPLSDVGAHTTGTGGTSSAHVAANVPARAPPSSLFL